MDKRVSEIIKLYNYSTYQRIFTYLRWYICPFLEMEKLLPSNGTILDIGCGTGIFANFLALSSEDRDVVGIDISKSKLNIASSTVGSRNNIKFINGDINQLNLDNINAVVMSDFLHHLNGTNQNKILNNLFLKLQSNGKLLIKEINAEDGLRYFASFMADKIIYPNDECSFLAKSKLIEYLSNLGFKVETKKTLRHIPLSTNLYICKKTDNFEKLKKI